VGFQPFHISMRPKYGLEVPPPAFATAVPAMFEALLDVFAPLSVALAIDDDLSIRIERLDEERRYGSQPLWCDEELTRHPLTSCKPDLGADVIAELYDRLANTTPKWLYVSAQGALRHVSAGTTTPAWYGHWRMDQTLRELATVSFTWTRDPLREFDMYCPLSGYPFTATKPLHRPELGNGDFQLARQNRELLMPALCRVREALGFDREEVYWHIDGHSYEKRDFIDLQTRWLPVLSAS
jgi:hypothetical protein